MTDNSNENIKEIFVEMIKEVDEISLKSYINSLSRYLQDYNREFKENKFNIKPFCIERKTIRSTIRDRLLFPNQSTENGW